MFRATLHVPRLGRSPLSLLVVLGGITIGSAVSLVYLGAKLLQQDTDLKTQRAHERLEHDADRVVQVIERRLADIDTQLTSWLEAPPATIRPFDAGIGVVLTDSGVGLIPPTRLLFYPLVAERREPPSSLFADAERLEFQQNDYEHAGDAFRELARSVDPTTRAAALMRLGRVRGKAGKFEAALAAYREMATLRDVTVFQSPGDLVARVESARVLQRLGRRDDAREAAHSVLADLAAGRWELTRGQYETFTEDLVGLAGAAGPPSNDVFTSLAVAELWDRWQAQRTTRDRRVSRLEGVPALMILRGRSDRAVAFIVRPHDLMAELTWDPALAITLTDADGQPLAGNPVRPTEAPAVRASVDSRLPWTMHVSRVSDTVVGGGTPRTLAVSGLLLMVVFLGAGAFFIARAINREAELAQLQSNFVAAVSHEFRTPLAAMRQFSELLADGRVPSDNKRQHYYESLASESRRLQRLVENLLNFSRLDAGARPYQLAPVDLRSLVHDVVSEFQSQLAGPECVIEVGASPDPAPLMADRDAIALALYNLLDNAVKYSGGNQSVRVDWEQHGDRIGLSVHDRGPGISAAEQPQIFQRFFRGAAAASANVRGTGIGLAMVKLVVTGHGGDVRVESTPGQGSTFTMLLPVTEAT